MPKTPTGREITEEQIEEEGRKVCDVCGLAVVEEEWLGPDRGYCLYCWEADHNRKWAVPDDR